MCECSISCSYYARQQFMLEIINQFGSFVRFGSTVIQLLFCAALSPFSHKVIWKQNEIVSSIMESCECCRTVWSLTNSIYSVRFVYWDAFVHILLSFNTFWPNWRVKKKQLYVMCMCVCAVGTFILALFSGIAFKYHWEFIRHDFFSLFRSHLYFPVCCCCCCYYFGLIRLLLPRLTSSNEKCKIGLFCAFVSLRPF